MRCFFATGVITPIFFIFILIPCAVERFFIYSSYFKLHVLRLRSLPPVTYLCKLLGIHSLAAFLQLELFRV